ncbi:hypothetical protein [Streptomyces sp. NPDC004680]|uniref:hypothetical protein n=1 Tax=Streptomyces sp. NPDC004680 TaxID=3154287 RepID=UPI00339F2083
MATAARAARTKSVVGTVGLASLTGFFLMSMLDHLANLDRIDILFWCVLAVIMADAPVARRRPGGSPAPGPARMEPVAQGPRPVGADVGSHHAAAPVTGGPDGAP